MSSTTLQVACLLEIARRTNVKDRIRNWDKIRTGMDGKAAKAAAPGGVTFDDDGNVTAISLNFCGLTGESS